MGYSFLWLRGNLLAKGASSKLDKDGNGFIALYNEDGTLRGRSTFKGGVRVFGPTRRHRPKP